MLHQRQEEPRAFWSARPTGPSAHEPGGRADTRQGQEADMPVFRWDEVDAQYTRMLQIIKVVHCIVSDVDMMQKQVVAASGLQGRWESGLNRVTLTSLLAIWSFQCHHKSNLNQKTALIWLAFNKSFLPPGLPAGFEQQEQGWGGGGHYRFSDLLLNCIVCLLHRPTWSQSRRWYLSGFTWDQSLGQVLLQDRYREGHLAEELTHAKLVQVWACGLANNRVRSQERWFCPGLPWIYSACAVRRGISTGHNSSSWKFTFQSLKVSLSQIHTIVASYIQHFNVYIKLCLFTTDWSPHIVRLH